MSDTETETGGVTPDFQSTTQMANEDTTTAKATDSESRPMLDSDLQLIENEYGLTRGEAEEYWVATNGEFGDESAAKAVRDGRVITEFVLEQVPAGDSHPLQNEESLRVAETEKLDAEAEKLADAPDTSVADSPYSILNTAPDAVGSA